MIRILLLVICIVSGGSLAEEAVQTDWSGGGGGDDPVDDWGVGFEDGQDVSWLALPASCPSRRLPRPRSSTRWVRPRDRYTSM